MKSLVLLSFLLAFASAVTPTYRACDSHGQLTSLDVTPCEGTEGCNFPRGRNVTLTVTFRTDKEIRAARPVVYAHLGPVTVPEPFPMEQDSCRFFESPCPMAANVEHTYTTTVYIQPAFPTLRVAAEWQVHDQDDETVICFAVPVVVVD